ncbi:FkbM family methyltransferase [Methylorubrum aminovorans]|uniref:FkbM family methyltransferase n=1 Tax=Methylorubrum aminovorans TaxID=269069 RepID=UPI003C2AFAD3
MSSIDGNIFQIFFSDDPVQDPYSVASFRHNKNSILHCYPQHKHQLLKDDDAEAFLSAHFDGDVLNAYKSLVPYAYRKDLVSYCLLLAHGGIFVDLVMRMISPLVLPSGKSIACFRDAFWNHGAPWAVSNGLLAAEKGRPELRLCIDLVVQHCRDRYYGASSVHPTGPGLLGRALAIVDRGEDLEIGQYECLTGSPDALSFGYTNAHGRIIALRIKPDGGHIERFGLRGTNQYHAMWQNRSIYASSHESDNEKNPTGFSSTLNGEQAYMTAKYLPQWDQAPIFAQLCAALKPDLICEVGAFDGRDTQIFADRNPGTPIVSFEANPENFFEHSLSQRMLQTQASVQHIAISNRDGMTEIIVPGPPPDSSDLQKHERRGMGSMLHRPDLPDSRSFPVCVRRLDTFFATMPRTTRFALWVDVEGNTKSVLEGATGILDRIVLVKLELETIEYWKDQAVDVEILSMMEGYGFKVICTSDPSVKQYDAIFVRQDSANTEVDRIVSEAIERAA